MAITKTPSGKWLGDFQPEGRGGKRTRKVFKTKAEAKNFEIWLREHSKDPAWIYTRDKRKLSTTLDLWYASHGQLLKSGDDTLARIKRFAEDIGDPCITDFTAEHYTLWRAAQIADGTTANTCNRIHAYLKAAINALIRTKVLKIANPLSGIKQIKIDEQELSFLSLEKIKDLLATLKSDGRNKHAFLIAKLCLATGGRWSEGEELRITQLQGNIVQYARTKSSKARGVPIAVELAEEIKTHHEKFGQEDQVFGTAYNAFREGIKRAQIKLPPGQMTHVLRHTFASHFVQKGGNIVTLQRILGHHTITMTMRYAHLAPDHLSDAVRLNPLAGLDR